MANLTQIVTMGTAVYLGFNIVNYVSIRSIIKKIEREDGKIQAYDFAKEYQKPIRGFGGPLLDVTILGGKLASYQYIRKRNYERLLEEYKRKLQPEDIV